MKSVVITGSARGFGYEMIKLFRELNYNIVITDINELALNKAYESLLKIKSSGEILAIKANVCDEDDVKNLIEQTVTKFKTIDIFINNAGVNQPMKDLWDLDKSSIEKIINIDLFGSILCSKYVSKQMIKQNSGTIYFVEGFGSNGQTVSGLAIYGTAKRGISYFASALKKELKEKNCNVGVGIITPGIMVTNFMFNSLGDGEKIELGEKTKKIYNILADKPFDIANYIVKKINKNKKLNPRFVWLTTRKVFFRFLKAPFSKRDLFKNSE